MLGKVLTISSAQSQMATIECYPSSADDLHYGRVLKDSEIHLDGVETLDANYESFILADFGAYPKLANEVHDLL